MSAMRTPVLIWAQRHDKVFITFECIGTKDVDVTLSAGLLSLTATDAQGNNYKLENMPLFGEIEEQDSKWFRNDRAVIMSLKKKSPDWWDLLSKEKTLKRFIKADFSKWCEEDDREYMGEIAGMDSMDGMGMGGMGDMGMGDMSGMMGGQGWDDDDDDDDADADLSDLDPSKMPGGEGDEPPDLEDDDGPPPLESDGKPNVKDMEEVD